MIYLKNNETNTFVLTLRESSTLSSPYYLFQFENEFIINPEPIYFTTDDLSMFICRFNMFELTLSDTGSENGGIDIPLKMRIGQWKYTVYESEIQTLDPLETTGKIIETGRLIVAGSQTDVDINSVYY